MTIQNLQTLERIWTIIKNEGDIMKRLLCSVLVLILLPALAGAIDLEEFNVMAGVLGAAELDMANAKKADNHIGFTQDGCFVYFDEKDGEIANIFIQGEGDVFLSYCCAAIHVFDPDGSTTQNHGQLLTMYLMAHTSSEYQTGQTSTGNFFFLEASDGMYMFMIGES